jgi:spore germination protein
LIPSLGGVHILKRIVAAVLLVLFIGGMLPGTALAEPAIKVVLDGRELNFDVPPAIERDRVLVPFRKIGEAMGAVVGWNSQTRTVYGIKGSTRVELKIDNTYALVNGKKTSLDMPAVIRGGRTLVPLRFFTEAFGALVDWDGTNRVVTINAKPGTTKPKGPMDKVVYGYYYSKSYSDFMENYSSMTHTAFKWYTLDAAGNLTYRDDTRWIFVPEGYDEVLETAGDNKVKTHALVFENNSLRLKLVLNDEEKRDNLIDQIVELAVIGGFNGIDIDFENIRESEKDAFNTFIKLLAARLHKEDKNLSISLPVKTEKVDWHKGYDYATLGKYADLMILMAYDKDPATPEPQAAIGWVEEVVDYAVARIPAQKVILGIGFYGYNWSSGGRGTVLLTRKDFDSGVKFIDELEEHYKAKSRWDEKSMMSTLEYYDELGRHHIVWYEDEKSLQAKIELARNKDIGGIALWRLGYMTPGAWKLIEENFK